MNFNHIKRICRRALAALALVAALDASAAHPLAEYWGTAMVGASTGEFAPYLMSAMNHGKAPYKTTALLDLGISRRLDTSTRFSWGFGVEALTGYQYANKYDYWDATSGTMTQRKVNPPAVWLQQLYGEVKWRGVFLTVGLKEHSSLLYDNFLGSGDLVESGNARPIPEARAGFIDFQNIPFVNGWVQIQGEVAYGIMPDDGYLKSHFNHYNYHITLNSLYVYKRCYLRSKPSQPFMVTAGMQAISFFGGTCHRYRNGVDYRQQTFSKSIGTFAKMLLPIGRTGEDFYSGSTMGSWDFQARYRLRNDDELYAYFQWPWEDGSGIGRMNGWDGVWGVRYQSARRGWVDGALVEYLDFRNQSGPLHFAPGDFSGNDIISQATGEDNYYNNYYYNAFANYGMAIGSPYFKAPLYNLDGFPGYTCNRMNGFHAGISGHPVEALEYRVIASYSHGLGLYAAPFYHPRDNYSMLFEASWDAERLLPGLSTKLQAAFDTGELRGNTFGMMLTVNYRGLLSLKK